MCNSDINLKSKLIAKLFGKNNVISNCHLKVLKILNMSTALQIVTMLQSSNLAIFSDIQSKPAASNIISHKFTNA